MLKILHSAMENDTDGLNNVPFKSAEVKLYSASYDKEFTYSIEQKNAPIQVSETNVENIQSVLFTVGGTIRSELPRSRNAAWTIKPKLPPGFLGRWQHRYLPTSRLYLGIGRSVGSLYSQPFSEAPSEEQLDLNFAHYLQLLWSQYSSDILNAVRKAQEDGLASIFKAFLSAKEQRETEQQVDPKIAYDRVADFLNRQGSPGSLGTFAEFRERYAGDSSFRSVVNDINDVEIRIEQAMSPREKLQQLIQEMFSGNKTVLLQDNSVEITTYQNTGIGLNTLSSGEKHLLRIFIDTLMAGESSILIDEPEISMHIDWQRQLIKAMHQLSPSAQLILATHSPEIMADIPDDRIFRL